MNSQDQNYGPRDKITLELPADGREVFLPPLDPGRVYEFTAEGTCRFRAWLLRGEVDALYETDGGGSFCKPHEWLKLDGAPFRRYLEDRVDETLAKEDRETHRYSFRLDGTGGKMPVYFSVWGKANSLTLTVHALPEGTPSPRAGRQRDQTAKKTANLISKLDALRLRAHCESHYCNVEFQQDFVRNRMKEILQSLREEWAREYDQLIGDVELTRLAKERAPQVLDWLGARVKIVQLAERISQTAKLTGKLDALRLRAHRESHYCDPEFQEHFARSQTEAILGTWKYAWGQEYDEVMRDAHFKRLAEEQAPQVFAWLEARVRIVQLAERIKVAPAPLPEPPEARKRRTAEQVRAIKLRRDEVQADDKIARAKLRGQKLLEAKAALELLPLDQDARETLEAELAQDLLEGGDENQGNGGTAL